MIPRCIAVVAILGWLRALPAEAAPSGPWTPLAQFSGSGTCSVAVSPDFAQDRTIWAGTPGYGLYSSHDAGRSWTGVDVPDASSGACPVVLSPSYQVDGTVLVTTDEPYMSTDGGTTWTPLAMAALPSAYAFSPNFATDHTILAAADTGPVLRSVDAGRTWTQVANWQDGLPPAGHFTVDQLSLAASGQALLATDDGVFRSEDSGLSWQPADAGLPMVQTVDPATGKSFRRIPPAAGAVVSDQSSGTSYVILDISRRAQLFSSVAGAAWNSTAKPLAANASSLISATGPQGATLVVGSTDDGVFTTDDAGQTWVPLDQGLSDEDLTSLAATNTAPSTLVAGASYDGVFVRPPGTTSWTTGYAGMAPTDPALALLHVSGHSGSTLLAGTLSGVFRSTDGGASWNAFDAGLPGERSVTSFATAGSSIFAATPGGVYRSLGGSGNWHEVGSHLMRGVNASVVAAQPKTTGTPFGVAAGTENGLFSSPDGAHHWHMVVKGDMNIEALSYSPIDGQSLYALCDGQLLLYSPGHHHVVADVQGGLPLVAFALSPISGTPSLIATMSTAYRRSGNRWVATIRLSGDDLPVMAYVGRTRVLVADGSNLLASTDYRHWSEYAAPGEFPIAALAPLPGGAADVSLAGAGVWRFNG